MVDLDWNGMWMEAMNNATWMKGCKNLNVQTARKRAEQYNKDAFLRETRNNQVGKVVSKLRISPGSTIMDIGAGPGTLAIPLSKIARCVTAVEPSIEMIYHLKKNAQECGIANICHINKKWEDVMPFEDANEHDFLIASYSLYMLDIKAALLKMVQLASRGICLFTFVGNPYWDYSEIWPELYGEEYEIGPDYIYIYNLLHDMGIYANVDIENIEHVQHFENIENATNLWYKNLDVYSEKDERIIRSYLSENLIEECGELLSKHYMKSAMIWWMKDDE